MRSNKLQLFRQFRKLFKQTSYQTLSSLAAYAQWAPTYPAVPHNVLMQAEHQAMLNLMPTLLDRVVLDLACGTGRWGQWALAHGASSIIGIDNSHAMLSHAKLQHRIQAGMTALPLPDESVDVVLCGLALGHLPTISMQLAIQEMGRVLRPNGSALISDFHPILAWSGAQRTFTAPSGKVYAVEHHIHRYTDYFGIAMHTDLQISGIEEPSHPDTPDDKPLVLALRLTKAV